MSAEVQAVVKVENRLPARQPNSTISKKTKIAGDDSARFKFGSRKRSQTFMGGKISLLHKKRKKDSHIPPTKFLLGGNIRDPLNLNSFQDEEVNRAMNAFTPESSPLPTPQHRKCGEIEVIIPPNIRDPLNLAGGEDDNDAYAASFLPAPAKKLKKKNKKKRQRSSAGSGKEEDVKSDESKGEEVIEQEIKMEVPKTSEIEPVVEAVIEEDVSIPEPAKEVKKTKPDKELPLEKENQKEKRKFFDSKDRIVSPVVPQPGAWADRPGHRFKKLQQRPAQHTPKFKDKNKKFQYGNYNRYYGYRNPNHEVDPRLKLLAQRHNIFAGKDVLDIGCNTGHLTLSIARDLGAKKVVGIDIDKDLIASARANVRKYSTNSKKFPMSMPLVYGSVEAPGVPSSNLFPHNVQFVHCNYVLESDVLVDLEQPQFDVILCLSVTKWFHLNWGDAGLKRAFARMFSQLRPGGVLVLEPQPWYSYKGKKTLTETIWKNFSSIKLKPHMFTEYLLSEVGFAQCEVLGAPFHTVKSFERPIRLYTKSKELKEEIPNIEKSLTITPNVSHETSTSDVKSENQR